MPEDVFRWVVAVAVVLAAGSAIAQAVILFAVYKAAKEAQKIGQTLRPRLSR